MSPKTNAEPAKEKLNSLFAPAPRKPNTELPTPERSTKNPSANCSPRPQARVLSLIARRLVENSHAIPRITAMPSTPVKRPMNTPLRTTDASANQAAHQRPLFSRGVFADVITVHDEALCFDKFGVAIVMNRGQRFSLFHAIADPLVEFQADAVIDPVFLFLAASAEHGQRDAKLLAVGAGDESAGGTRYVEMQARGGQTFRLVNDALVAALQANPLPEFLESLAGGNHGFGEAPAIFLFLHEGAGARLHVEDQRVDPLGKLLAHDRGADQADILDRRSNIAQRVDLLVGRSNLRGLPDQAHAAFAQNAAKFVQRQIHVEARNRFQLIQRAT